MSESGIKIVRFGDVPWEPRSEDDWPCLVKRQLFDAERDMTIRIVWYARGAVEPRHVHGGSHAAFLLLGSAEIDGVSLGPWDVVYGPGNHPHGPLDFENPDYQSDPQVRMLHGEPVGGSVARRKVGTKTGPRKKK